MPEPAGAKTTSGVCAGCAATDEWLAARLGAEEAAAGEAREDLRAKEEHLQRKLRSCEENVKSFLAD